MTELILFHGRIGMQRLRVWVTDAGGALRIQTHETGPELEQRRKGSGVPYISHLLGTCAIALEYGADRG